MAFAVAFADFSIEVECLGEVNGGVMEPAGFSAYFAQVVEYLGFTSLIADADSDPRYNAGAGWVGTCQGDRYMRVLA